MVQAKPRCLPRRKSGKIGGARFKVLDFGHLDLFVICDLWFVILGPGFRV